jgi:sentrin-specific protease 8
MDDKVLDYGDALLRVRDVALLTGRHWLNDALLSFYFEWLRRERADRPGVALVDASVGFLVANATPDVAAEVLGASRVDRAELVLFQARPAPARPPPRRIATPPTPRPDRPPRPKPLPRRSR